MSKYQYYGLRKIESSLSDEAIQEISDLSSRAQVSRTSASFTYHYSDFRGDPIKVLTLHFDALFYTASWGSRRVAFRFRISANNYEVFRRFAFSETIDIKRKDAHLIVDLFFQDESLCDRVDGERTLDGHLRDQVESAGTQDLRNSRLFFRQTKPTVLRSDGFFWSCQAAVAKIIYYGSRRTRRCYRYESPGH